jgi:integrase
MEKYLDNKLAEFRNEKHRRQWRSTLDRYAIPKIGTVLVADLSVADMLRVLQSEWQSKTETMSRLRGRLEAILAWAAVAGHREGENVARWKGNLDQLLPSPGKIAKTVHFPALALNDAPDWFAEVRRRKGIATKALEFLAMCASRSGEIRGATWSEIDLELGLWTIPAERMKAQSEHRVPLTTEAVALLKELPVFQGSDYVFAASRGGMLSDAALSACMKRVNEANESRFVDPRTGRPSVPHGLRSCFRDWCAERSGYSRELAELSLAHVVGSDVERAYRRSDMFNQRRQLLADWQRFLRGEQGAEIVALESRR